MRVEKIWKKARARIVSGIYPARIKKFRHGPDPGSYVLHAGRSRAAQNPDSTRTFAISSIWALQPPELVSYIEDLESQFRDIERRVYNIQLELEGNSIRG